jgi:hypothetical protein
MGGSHVITSEPGEHFDLCPRCYVKFKEFMRGRELLPDGGIFSVNLIGHKDPAGEPGPLGLSSPEPPEAGV